MPRGVSLVQSRELWPEPKGQRSQTSDTESIEASGRPVCLALEVLKCPEEWSGVFRRQSPGLSVQLLMRKAGRAWSWVRRLTAVTIPQMARSAWPRWSSAASS